MIDSLNEFRTLVFKSDLRTGEKMTLLALADYHGFNGEIYPSYSHLARKVGGSVGGVRKWLSALEASGWVRRERREKDGLGQISNSYVLSLPAGPVESVGDAPQGGAVSSQGRGGVLTGQGPCPTGTPNSEEKLHRGTQTDRATTVPEKYPGHGGLKGMVDKICKTLNDGAARALYEALAKNYHEGHVEMALAETEEAMRNGEIRKSPAKAFRYFLRVKSGEIPPAGTMSGDDRPRPSQPTVKREKVRYVDDDPYFDEIGSFQARQKQKKEGRG